MPKQTVLNYVSAYTVYDPLAFDFIPTEIIKPIALKRNTEIRTYS